jgi:hypothetical protein
MASCGGRSRWPNFSTQQWPEPMESTQAVLPPGVESEYPEGPEEVILRRLADPVQLKPAGQHAAFPLRYFDKRRRANAGAWVFVSAGGKAEVLWPDTGTTLVLYDLCTGIVGSPSRGEPNFILREIERVEMRLSDGDQVELPGGALLTADSGPWLAEKRSFSILRIKNQSKKSGEVAYRDEVFLLGPGHTLDLPLGTTGGKPILELPGTRQIPGPGFDLSVFGDVQVEEDLQGFVVSGQGEHEIQGLGVRVQLGPGESARFSGLGDGKTVGAAPYNTSGRSHAGPDPTPTQSAAPEVGTSGSGN